MSQLLKILIVEDNPIDAELVQRTILEDIPYSDFLLVKDKDAYIRSIEQYQPDIVLSDNTLPRFSGSEALTITRKMAPHLPFILVTGTVSEEFAVNIIKQGADDYILKDRLARLTSSIEVSLKYRQAERQKACMVEELIASEEKYRQVIERIADGFMAVDNDWRITYINKVAAEMFGKEPGYMLGKNMKEEFPVGDGGPFYSAYQKAAETQEPIVVEDYSMVLKKWLQASFYPSASGVSIFLRDLSPQRLAELEARKSDAKFRAFVERITDAFIALDDEWRYTYINKKTEVLIKKNANEIIGKKVWDIFPDAVGSLTYQAFHNAMQHQQYENNIDYYPPLNLWQENHVYPSPDGLTIFIRDISEKKNQEIEIGKAHGRLAAILNTLPANIVLLNSKGFIIEVNESWKAFAGDNGFYEDQYGIGKNYMAVAEQIIGAGQEARKIVKEGIEKILTGQSKRFEYEYDYHWSTEKRWFRMIASPVRSTQLDGLVVMHLDITELKKLEHEKKSREAEEQRKITRAVLQAQQRERDMIGSELHDNINQILVGALLMLSTIRTDAPTVEKAVQSSISSLQEAINETRKLAHELVSPDFKTMSLVSRLTNMISSMFDVTGIAVAVEQTKLKEQLLLEEQKLAIYRIMQEHCMNIVKHARASKVDLTIATTGGYFRLAIWDNGIGMEKTEQTSGIGLRNIRARVNVLQGSIKIDTALGKGFKLVVKFPLAFPDKK